MWRVSRFHGGIQLLQRHIQPWLFRRSRTVLDVAAGTGDVGRGLVNWAAQQGATLHATVLDNSPEALKIARERTAGLPGVAVVQGDALRMPFGPAQFDLVFCNLALHRFGAEEAVQVLREMDRVSNLGWIVTDLARHPLSVRRCYHETEARELVSRAGVKARVARHFPFRLAIVSHRV